MSLFGGLLKNFEGLLDEVDASVDDSLVTDGEPTAPTLDIDAPAAASSTSVHDFDTFSTQHDAPYESEQSSSKHEPSHPNEDAVNPVSTSASADDSAPISLDADGWAIETTSKPLATTTLAPSQPSASNLAALENLEKERVRLEASVASLVAAMQARDSELLALQSEHRAERDSHARLKAEFTEYKAKANALLSKKDAQLKRMEASLESPKSASGQSSGDAAFQSSIAASQKSEWEERLRERDALIITLQQQLQDVKREALSTAERLQADVQFEHENAELLERELTNTRRQLTGAQMEVETLQRQLQAARKDVVDARAELASYTRSQTEASSRAPFSSPSSSASSVSSSSAQSHAASIGVDMMVRDELVEKSRQLEELTRERNALLIAVDDLTVKLHDATSKIAILRERPRDVEEGGHGSGFGGGTGLRHREKERERTVRAFESRLGPRAGRVAAKLDSWSWSAGRLLAQHDWARVGVLLYIVLLHVYVSLVLTMRAHGPSSAASGQPSLPMNPQGMGGPSRMS
jgi:predicted  nucleic acid-binding Zn-ribbon protein